MSGLDPERGDNKWQEEREIVFLDVGGSGKGSTVLSWERCRE